MSLAHNRQWNRTLLPEGEPQTDATIAAMADLVRRSDDAGVVHQLAVAIAADLPQKAYPAQLRAVYDFLRDHVRMKRDLFGAEVLRDPTNLVREIAEGGTTSGDCDDVAMLGAALIRALGFRACFVVVSEKIDGPWVHVFYGAVAPDGRVTPFDPQERVPPGRWPRHAKKKIYPIE